MEVKQNAYFMRRMLAVVLIIVFILSLGSLGYWWSTTVRLDSRTYVISTAKFKINPLPWRSHKTVRFNITIECYQKPELTTLDLSKVALLSDGQDSIQKPISWTPKRESPYKVTGELEFPAPETKPQQWILSIFTEEETQFKWSLL